MLQMPHAAEAEAYPGQTETYGEGGHEVGGGVHVEFERMQGVSEEVEEPGVAAQHGAAIGLEGGGHPEEAEDFGTTRVALQRTIRRSEARKGYVVPRQEYGEFIEV